MLRRLPLLSLLLAAVVLTFLPRPSGAQKSSQVPPPADFKKTPEVPAMPKALMKLPRTPITRAKFPAVDFHFHGRSLRTVEDYQKLIKIMDDTRVAVIADMDGGFGPDFDRNMKLGEPYKDRIVHFARLN